MKARMEEAKKKGIKRPDRPTMPPTPPKPPGPVRPRGTSPAPGYGGGKPVTIKPGTIKPKSPGMTVTTPKPIKTPIRDGRGTAAAPGYGGGKPRRMMSGGMVKGKKK
jgi:hypothetical protein